MRVLSLIVMLSITAVLAHAQSDTTITYQGQLQEGGNLLDGETVGLFFELYDDPDPASGTLVSSDGPFSVAVKDGLFQAELDFGQVDYTVAKYLRIQVNGTWLAETQEITSVPVAQYALGAGGVQWTNVLNAPKFWRLGGNAGTTPGTDVLGTTDNTPLEVHVNSARALRIEPGDGPNIIAGSPANQIIDDVSGATVAGGADGFGNFVADHFGTIGGGRSNQVGTDDGDVAGQQWATVGGGAYNTASGERATVAGGNSNRATDLAATVGGGTANTAGSWYATVPGGYRNEAVGLTSFAAGSNAKANHNGAFVWADSKISDFASTGEDQFLVRASGGALFRVVNNGMQVESDGSGTSHAAIQAESLNADGIALTARNDSNDATVVINNRGSGQLIRAFNVGTLLMELRNSGDLKIAGSLIEGSDRNSKTAIRTVDPDEVLEKLGELEISSWQYRDDSQQARHMGPMAQDFHALFELGDSPTGLAGTDVRGVALAAIQALARRNEDLQVSVNRQAKRLEALEKENSRLTKAVEKNAAMADRNRNLERRLAALESLLLENERVARSE